MVRSLTVLAGCRYFHHWIDRFYCLTVYGETQCACGAYQLTWEDEQ